MGFNFRNELYNKLDSNDWDRVGYYINKAQEFYDNDKDDDARAALLDAVAVSRAAGEYYAADKIYYYTRFC